MSTWIGLETLDLNSSSMLTPLLLCGGPDPELLLALIAPEQHVMSQKLYKSVWAAFLMTCA